MLHEIAPKIAAPVSEERLNHYKEAYDNDDIIFNRIDNRLMINFCIERTLVHAKGESVLELGIGHQYTINPILNRYKKYTIVEGSISMIEAARKQYAGTHVEFVHSFFETYKPTEKFDTIIMGFVLEHVDDPAAILNRYKHFLKEGGSIFMSVPNCEALNRRFGYHANMIKDLFELSPFDIAVGHQRAFSLKTFTNLAVSCGFKVIRSEGLFLKPLATQQIIDFKISEEILRAMLEVGIDYPELCVSMLLEITPTDR